MKPNCLISILQKNILLKSVGEIMEIGRQEERQKEKERKEKEKKERKKERKKEKRSVGLGIRYMIIVIVLLY